MSVALFNSYLSGLLDWLWNSTVQASVVICVILCLQALLRGRLAARWRYCLWLVVVLRMVTPWAPESRVSLFNALPGPVRITPVDSVVPGAVKGAMRTDPDSPLVHETEHTSRSTAVERPHPVALTGLDPPGRKAAGVDEVLRPIHVLPLIWLAVSLILAVRVAAASLTLHRTVKRQGRRPDRAILDLLADCASRIGVKSLPAVILAEGISAPMVFGFARPRLLLPPEVTEELGPGELRHVFLHELAHVRRRDMLVGWVTALLQIMHWFNPLVWLAFARMRADREEACDALVLANTPATESKDYGRTIVRLLEHWSKPRVLLGTVGVLESRSQLKRRIAMIARFKKGTYRASLLGLCLLVLVCAVSLTNARARSGPEGTEVFFRLADGTSLFGTTGLAGFKMQLADAPPDRIVRKEGEAGAETWSVEFRNGDILSGVLDPGSLELLTQFGKGPLFGIRQSLGVAETTVKRVAGMKRAKDGRTWSVDFRNGDRLTGGPELDTLDVTTQFGTLSVNLDNVESIAFVSPAPPPSVELPEGLALYYRFDRPASAVDESGKGRDGTIHGGEFEGRGKFGGALRLDGSTYVRNGDILIGPEVTYGAWIKLDTLATGWSFYVCRAGEEHGTLSGHHYTVELLQSGFGGMPRIRACGASASIVDGKYEFTDLDRWYHIAVTVDESGNLTIYVNGEEDLSGEVTTTQVGSLYIGKSGFKGLIDEFMVFDRALSKSEVARLYESAVSAEPAGAENTGG
ncbi:MAG: M56 family metallopeptidase [Planctomycetota bacterium]|jgi:bla regulator protein BlaR1